MNCKTDVSVVIPTRDEASNITPLVERLMPPLRSIGVAEIIFVDDSDDDTPSKIRGASSPIRIQLIHRQRELRYGGLGGAVLEGFKRANGTVIVVMDADLQHPPEMIPSLVAPIKAEDAEIVIASRFVEGGTSSGLSGPVRRLAAAATRVMAGYALPRIRHVSDPMSGYFAISRSVLKTGPIWSDGFKILLDVLAQGSWSAAVEVPYVFAEREAGESKASAAVAMAYLRQLWRIRKSRM